MQLREGLLPASRGGQQRVWLQLVPLAVRRGLAGGLCFLAAFATLAFVSSVMVKVRTRP